MHYRHCCIFLEPRFLSCTISLAQHTLTTGSCGVPAPSPALQYSFSGHATLKAALLHGVLGGTRTTENNIRPPMVKSSRKKHNASLVIMADLPGKNGSCGIGWLGAKRRRMFIVPSWNWAIRHQCIRLGTRVGTGLTTEVRKTNGPKRSKVSFRHPRTSDTI